MIWARTTLMSLDCHVCATDNVYQLFANAFEYSCVLCDYFLF